MALFLSTLLFAALIGAFVGVKALNAHARVHSQALEVIRGRMELLKGTAFDLIVNSNTVIAFDAGDDATFNTLDDLTGTLVVTVQDLLDMDGDADTNEVWIDVDGDNVNDQVAKPVRVAFTWQQTLLGQTRTFTVRADTLIAA